MKSVLPLIAFTTLTACMDAPIQGSNDSGVKRLTVGMPADDVSQRIGAYQFESVDPSNGSFSCRSYVYDETFDPKYVHVYFTDGLVTTANDRHKTPCKFGPDVLG